VNTVAAGQPLAPPPPPAERSKVMPDAFQSSPLVERPWALTVAVKPPATVTWAMTALSDGPSSGDIQKTAPLSVVRPESAVQPSKSGPMELREPRVSPSVRPTVSQPSNSAPAMIAKNAGLAPPTLAPKGAASWYEGGMDRLEVSSP
jgi:hypothetical protein